MSAFLGHLPLVDATLNAIATVLLLIGRAEIKAGRRERHRRVMIAATVVSAAFLACYLTYHLKVVSKVGPTRFNRTGAVHTAYLAMLASHVVLAIVNLPMVLRTLYLAHRERWEAHRRWARVTWPTWLYVSVTGVLVYVVLYHWNPPAPV